MSSYWYIILALIWCGFVYSLSSDQHEGLIESKSISRFSLSILAEINQSEYEELIVVSGSEAIATTNQTLCLLELENGTTTLAAEENLQADPSELHTVYFEGTINVALSYSDHLDVFQYRRNSNDSVESRRVTPVHYDSFYYWPSSNVVVSARTRNSILYITAVYIFDNSLIITYNPLIDRFGGFFNLPTDCSCNNCQLQPSYNDRQGQVIIRCSNENQYLCNLYEEECFLLPRSIWKIATSRNDRKLAVAIKHSPDLDQDLLLMLAFDDDQDTTYKTLASSKASVRHPGRILDLAIVPINGSNQEVVCFLDSDSIFCFVLRGVEDWPVIEAVALPANVTVREFQGATDSSLAVEVTFPDNRPFLVQVGITITELGNSGLQLNTTVCPNETIALSTVEPPVTATKHVEMTSTITSPSSSATSVSPTQTPGDNSCQRDR